MRAFSLATVWPLPGSIGGNAIQAVAGVILAAALYAVLSKVPQIKKAAA